MKIELDIQKIKANSQKVTQPIKIRIKIGESIAVSTELVFPSSGLYPYFQKNTIQWNDQRNEYIEVFLINEANTTVSHKTIFMNNFVNILQCKKEGKKLDLQAEQNLMMTIFYSYTEINDDLSAPTNLALRKITSIVDSQPERIHEEVGKLEILNLGKLMFNFGQRLDPFIFIYTQIMKIIAWRTPYVTFGIGVLLTMIIFNFKTSIFIGGLLLMFRKNWFFAKIRQIHKYKDIHKRLIVPTENAVFLQNGMEDYCQTYKKVSDFLFNEDKSLLVEVIHLVCAFGLFMIVLLLIFEIEFLLVFAIWMSLALTSPYRLHILKFLAPFFSFLMHYYNKITHNIGGRLITILKSRTLSDVELNIAKQYYFYQYDRWWLLKEWVEESKKFSDEQFECKILPKQLAPSGWVWIEEWKLDFTGDVDHNGYQYRNDLIQVYSSKLSLATIRRRKWKRTCVPSKEKLE